MIWNIEGFVHYINALSPGSPYAMPKRSMTEVKELLTEHGYDNEVVETVNQDMLIGYFAAMKLVMDINDEYGQSASRLYDSETKEKHLDGLDKELLNWKLAQDVIMNVICDMTMIHLTCFNHTTKAHNKVMSVLREHEFEFTDDEVTKEMKMKASGVPTTLDGLIFITAFSCTK